MLFVKTEDLKPGMRLAKPIYNRNGVMLYERNSKITSQGIISVNNFGLIGIYILEPAEPVPPMSEDDIEFERFQAMSIFEIKEILDAYSEGKKENNMYQFINQLLKNMAHFIIRLTLYRISEAMMTMCINIHSIQQYCVR